MTSLLDFRHPLLVCDRPALSRDSLIHAGSDTEAVRSFLNEYSRSPHTERAYRKECVRFVLWLQQIAGLTLNTVRREDVERYFDFAANPPESWVVARAVPQGSSEWRPFRKGLSDSGLAYAKLVLTNLFGYLIEARYLDGNPFALMRQRSGAREMAQTTRRHRFSDVALEYIKEAIDRADEGTELLVRKKCRDKLVFLAFLHTGARLAEIAGTTTRDLVGDSERLWLQVLGKGQKYGRLPVTPTLLKALMQYRRACGLDPMPGPDEDVPILSRLRDHRLPISDNMVYRLIKRFCSDAAAVARTHGDEGVARILERGSTHWFRHTTIGKVVQETNDLIFGQRLGRHADVTTTAGYSTRAEDEFHDRMVSLLASW